MPMARAAAGFKVDPTGPIGEKWTEAGGAAKIGEPTSGDEIGARRHVRYQFFEKATIFFSEAFGAVLVDGTLFASWAKLGSKLQADMGPPIADSKSVFFGRGGSVRVATFQKGAIAARGSEPSRSTAGSTSAGERSATYGAGSAGRFPTRRRRRAAPAGAPASTAATSTGRAAPTPPPASAARSATSGSARRLGDFSAIRSPTRRWS